MSSSSIVTGDAASVPASRLAERMRRLHLPVGRGRTAWRRIRQSGLTVAENLRLVHPRRQSIDDVLELFPALGPLMKAARRPALRR